MFIIVVDFRLNNHNIIYDPGFPDFDGVRILRITISRVDVPKDQNSRLSTIVKNDRLLEKARHSLIYSEGTIYVV